MDYMNKIIHDVNERCYIPFIMLNYVCKYYLCCLNVVATFKSGQPFRPTCCFKKRSENHLNQTCTEHPGFIMVLAFEHKGYWIILFVQARQKDL